MFALEFITGLVYANAAEWALHKYVLHGLGKKKNSFFHFHWTHHHRTRKNNFYDDNYIFLTKHIVDLLKEAGSVVVLVAAHIPLLWALPGVFWAVALFGVAYMLVHAKSHRDPVWARKYLKHHVDHHMGKNQDTNWNVTFPLTDWIMGTRVNS